MTRADVVIAADGRHVYFNLTGGLRSVDEHPRPVPTRAVCSSEDGADRALLNPTTRAFNSQLYPAVYRNLEYVGCVSL